MKIPPEENQGGHRLTPSRCWFVFILVYLVGVFIVHDFVINVVAIIIVVVLSMLRR